jgi:hypothetical protein
MTIMLEMAEAILKTYRHADTVSRYVCLHCDCEQAGQAPLWIITHSPDCIVLKCKHLKKVQENPPAPINWSLYAQYAGRIKRINVMPEPLEVERAQLREYHANAVKNLAKYADDSDLRESDVKHYRKRAAFHQTMVETIDQVTGVTNE